MSSGQFQKQAVSVQIRWMIRRDMPEVLKIENESFEFNWTEEDFLACLRQRNCIGMVAEHDNRVVGFMIYELHKTKLHILNFAVAPAFRRLAVGAQMIEKLINKLSQQRRQEIVLEVRETNLAAQLFYPVPGFSSGQRLAKPLRRFGGRRLRDAIPARCRRSRTGYCRSTASPSIDEPHDSSKRRSNWPFPHRVRPFSSTVHPWNFASSPIGFCFRHRSRRSWFR